MLEMHVDEHGEDTLWGDSKEGGACDLGTCSRRTSEHSCRQKDPTARYCHRLRSGCSGHVEAIQRHTIEGAGGDMRTEVVEDFEKRVCLDLDVQPDEKAKPSSSVDKQEEVPT